MSDPLFIQGRRLTWWHRWFPLIGFQVSFKHLGEQLLYSKATSRRTMDLVVEVLPQDRQTGALVLSLCHYFELNGDLCQDPEMVVRVFPPRGDHPGRLEALYFQQASPPVFSVVYPEPGKVVPRLKRELNAFLGVWL